MKTKHSPAPWHLHKRSSELGYRIDCAGNEWQGLAVTYQAPDLEDEGAANAHLLVAAPELFDCVKSLVDAFPGMESDAEINGADAVEWLANNFHLFRAAIAKAEGEKYEMSKKS